MEEINILLISIAIGLIPALFWLWFWLREDSKNPEPRKMIALTFFLGMISVFLAIPMQLSIRDIIGPLIKEEVLALVVLISLKAFAEELVKLLAVIPALKSRFFDEPLDAVIYLITAALGFAALENMLYIYGFFDGTIGALGLGNQRFISSSLLHVVSSATVGFYIAFTFFKKKSLKLVSVAVGLFMATAIHALYNYLMSGTHTQGVWAFTGVWASVVLVFLLFEKVKRDKRELITKTRN